MRRLVTVMITVLLTLTARPVLSIEDENANSQKSIETSVDEKSQNIKKLEQRVIELEALVNALAREKVQQNTTLVADKPDTEAVKKQMLNERKNEEEITGDNSSNAPLVNANNIDSGFVDSDGKAIRSPEQTVIAEIIEEEKQAISEQLQSEQNDESKAITTPAVDKKDSLPKTDTQLKTDKPRSPQLSKSLVDPYASLRLFWAFDNKGRSEISDQSSRVGITGHSKFGSTFDAVARFEFGLNLAQRDGVVIGGGDASPPNQRKNDAVVSRLGYVGLYNKDYGSFRLGKMWSVYYDISKMTDEFHAWGGQASGTYNFNTDGALSGTGRSDQAFQYTNQLGRWFLGFQIQERASKSNDRFDAIGGSIRYEIESLRTRGLWDIGIAHTSVGDGTDTPNIGAGERHKDDNASIIGLRWRLANEYAGNLLAANYHVANYHEFDNEKQLLPKTEGFEFAGRWHISPHMPITFGYNHLKAKSENSQPKSQYALRYFLLGMNYMFSSETFVFAESKIDFSRKENGEKVSNDAISLGIYYGFD